MSAIKRLAEALNESAVNRQAVSDAILNGTYKVIVEKPKVSADRYGDEWSFEVGDGSVYLKADGLPDIEYYDFDNTFYDGEVDLSEYENYEELESALDQYRELIREELQGEYDKDGNLTWEGVKESFFDKWKDQLTDKLDNLTDAQFTYKNGYYWLDNIKGVYAEDRWSGDGTETYQEIVDIFKSGDADVTFYVNVHDKSEPECELNVTGEDILEALAHEVLEDEDFADEEPESDIETDDKDITDDTGYYPDWWNK